MKVGLESSIALAALLHDVGKFAQFAVDLSNDYRRKNARLYQPYRANHYTHSHALFTAYFLESMMNFIPRELRLTEKGNSWKNTHDTLIDLAAMHHKPESPTQWIIAEADRLSSGIDRDEFPTGKSIPISDAVKTRLIPVFEMLFSEEKASREEFSWRYPLEPMTARSIFPQKVKEGHDYEYKRLYEEFSGAFKNLAHRNVPYLWLQHLDSLYRIFASHIPAARVGNVVHDVSLYDHSRATASLAVALYRYHLETASFNENAIKDRTPEKFLIVSGDFYGIQSFIFSAGGEQRGRRSKLLRGRSFTVSVLIDLTAHEIAKSLGLSPLSVIMAAGGKFHLIAQNTDASRNKIMEVSEKLNDWLIKSSYGECAIGISYTELAPRDFLDGRFETIWTDHIKAMDEKKFRRFDPAEQGGVFEGFLSSFRNDLYRPLCPFCGKRPSVKEAENDSILCGPNERASACAMCRDHILVGTKIVKRHRVAITEADRGDLLNPLFGKYQLKFVKPHTIELGFSMETVDKFWDVNVNSDGKVPTDVTFNPINGYVPVYESEDEYDDRILAGTRSEEAKLELIDMIRDGEPKSFAHIASRALSFGNDGKLYGVDALGILKADVDNLGAIFSCGFRGRRFTLSRIATFSRMLNNFFSVYLPYALQNEKNGAFRDVYTVFAGGDDLFLIGPWNKVRDLTVFIADRFHDYTCRNEKLHLSAGITVQRHSTPVDVIAEQSEEALSMAKRAGRNRVTMFGRSVAWDDFRKLTGEIRETIGSWLDYRFLSRSSFYRILNLVEMAGLEDKLVKKGKGIAVMNIECVKWRAFLGYLIARNAARAIADRDKARRLQAEIAGTLANWINHYRDAMIIPFWSVLYETRRKRDR